MKEALHYMLKFLKTTIYYIALHPFDWVKMTNSNTLPERTLLTVSQLNQQAKRCLESNFLNVWVEGEISNFSAPASGHWYFTLKDSSAQIKAAMFRAKNSRVGYTPSHGQQVVVRGRISLYEGRGDYQLLVDDIEPAGEGKLQIAFEQLKKKMLDLGWFDEDRKKAIPDAPGHIALITSPTGAALQDMLSVAGRRYPLVKLTVLGAAVQGDLAAGELAQRLRDAHSLTERPDLIIIGRGGGSLEDLWAFNEPQVARAILDCEIPVISAVGHETDFSISDFVADLRAPTPSAAIELATPDIRELHQSLVGKAKRLLFAQRAHLETIAQRVDIAVSRLKHPSHKLDQQTAQLQQLYSRLHQAITRELHDGKLRSNTAHNALMMNHPSKRLALAKQSVANSDARLNILMQQLTEKPRSRLASAAALLNANSPLASFAKGYAAVLKEDGRLVKDAEEVSVGEHIDIRLAKGKLKAKVI